jgi:hypothetical protein
VKRSSLSLLTAGGNVPSEPFATPLVLAASE